MLLLRRVDIKTGSFLVLIKNIEKFLIKLQNCVLLETCTLKRILFPFMYLERQLVPPELLKLYEEFISGHHKWYSVLKNISFVRNNCFALVL